MPRRKTSLKTTRASKKKHTRNVLIKTKLKKSIKKFQALIQTGKLEEARKQIATVASALDKAAKKGIIHPRTSDRRKSRLARKLARSKSS